MNSIFVGAVFTFVLGLIFGSFLNALLFRFNTGAGLGGRSHCMQCSRTLGVLDLVPLFSWLSLGGRCRYCKSRISSQYPLVELVGGLLSLGVFLNLYPIFGANYLLFALDYALLTIFWFVLLFVVVYDLRHTIVPLQALGFLWGAALLLLLCSYLGMGIIEPLTIWGFLAGPLVALPLLLLSLFSQGRAMGWGDGLLMVAAGWLLGISGGYTALAIAFWSGAVVGLALLGMSAWRKNKVTPMRRMFGGSVGFTMSSEVPFAPFLALGTVIAYFFHVDIFHAIMLLPL